jgi:hypothetical protein
MTFVNYRKRAAIGFIASFVSLLVFFFLGSVSTDDWLELIFGFIVMVIALIACVYAIVNMVRFFRLARS